MAADTKETQPLAMRKNVVWNSVGAVFYQGCLWLMTVLVVKLSPDYQNSGALAFAMSIANVFNALATYNMRTYQISDTHDENSPGNYVALRIVTVSASLVIFFVYALVVAPSEGTFWVICAFLLFKADETFTNVLYAVDQKAGRMDFSGISQILRGVLCVAAFTVGMLTLSNLALTLVLVFACCLLVTLLHDLPRSASLVESLRPTISRQRCLGLLRKCFPAVVGLVMSGLIVSAARQYFGIAYGEEALGIYASVATPCVIIQVLAQNLYAPMLVPIARDFKDGRFRKAGRGAAGLLVLVLGVALMLSVGLSLFAEPLLGLLYGPSILPYTDVLLPAMIVTTGIAVTMLLGDLLIVFGELRLIPIMNGIALVVTMVLVPGATDLWYMNGLNYALIAGYALAIAFGLVSLLRSWKRATNR